MVLKSLTRIASAAVFASMALAGAAAGTLPEPPATGTAPLSAVARLGRALFYDPSLSGSGEMSCASCHSPANHYAPDNARAVQLGGPHLDRPGMRTVPTLTYKAWTPAFEIGPENPRREANEGGATGPLSASDIRQPKAVAAATNIVPEGGMFWDGRADTLEEQTLGPLLSPFEMANAGIHGLYETIKAGYGTRLSTLFGASVLQDEKMTVAEVGFALARYQMEDPAFHSFSSKYDAYLRGKARLSPAEARGLKLFNDPKKGNCASCHLDKITADGRIPAFTDYEYEALGLPRNPRIPANGDPHFFDLGICGPLRDDIYSRQPGNCGLFKTPTLRNVATRHAFFHNGVFHSLEDVLHFYVERDIEPGRFYPEGPDGKIEKYNDLPARYRANVDTVDAPLDRKPGDRPALDDSEIDDVIAFLKTLTDGYSR